MLVSTNVVAGDSNDALGTGMAAARNTSVAAVKATTPATMGMK